METKQLTFEELVDEALLMNSSQMWWEEKILAALERADTCETEEEIKQNINEIAQLIKKADYEIQAIDDWLHKKDSFLNAET